MLGIKELTRLLSFFEGAGEEDPKVEGAAVAVLCIRIGRHLHRRDDVLLALEKKWLEVSKRTYGRTSQDEERLLAAVLEFGNFDFTDEDYLCFSAPQTEELVRALLDLKDEAINALCEEARFYLDVSSDLELVSQQKAVLA